MYDGVIVGKLIQLISDILSNGNESQADELQLKIQIVIDRTTKDWR